MGTTARQLIPNGAEHAAGMRAYQEAGVKIAAEIGNRGPVRRHVDGNLRPDRAQQFI